MYRHLLVPLDGSELATSLVTQAVAFAQGLGARITFFTMRDDYGATSEGALARTLSPAAFAEASLGEANAILAKARAAAGEAGVAAEGIARVGHRPYELILDVAAECACDLIFMASHGRRGLKALLPGSQTRKVLAHSTLPVLVATVEANQPCEAGEVAIGIIKDEHRAIAAVCSGLRQQAALARSGGDVDVALLTSMLHYLRVFPEALHHPKEEQYLFARLSARTDGFDEQLAELEGQHDEGGALLAELEARATALHAAPGDAAALAALGEAVERFVELQWRHLNIEEKLILPAARQHLLAEDWAAIEQAFRDNARFAREGETATAFRQLFSRLMNQAQP